MAVENQREAHIVLHKENNRIAGVGGVNRLTGGYRLEGEKLTFTPGGMTMMAGPELLMNQERSFNEMLLRVNGYRIQGETLELLDGAMVLAEFRAVYLK